MRRLTGDKKKKATYFNYVLLERNSSPQMKSLVLNPTNIYLILNLIAVSTSPVSLEFPDRY